MRILYVGHTYLIDENQKKLIALSGLPGVELRLVVPHVWPEMVLGRNTPHTDGLPFPICPIRAVWPGHEMRYFYLSPTLGLRGFQPDLICVENGAGAFAYTQFLLARRMFAPRAKSVFFTWWNLPYRPRIPFRWQERWNLRRSDAAIAGNQEARDILRDHGFRGPIKVLPQLGVDETLFRRQAAWDCRKSLGLEHFVIGYVGRLVPEKGLRVLMQALTGAGFDFDLLILGRGPMEAEMREWAARERLTDRVRLLPSVPHREVAAYLNAMDVFVLPSLSMPFWKEQFGHVLIEAMACEVPVVGSDSAEIPRVIGEAGRIVPEGSPGALRATLAELSQSPELRRALGAAGRARVLQKYTHRRIAQETLSFFEEIVH